MKRLYQPTKAAIVALLLLSCAAAWAQQWSPQYEKEVGKQAAAQVEKQYKLIDNKAELKRLNTIASTIAAVSDRPKVKYTVKIVDSKEVNAFSLPGGYIYVTNALLADVQSDDELAAVLAHEIGHNCTYDALNRAEKDKKLFMGSLATALAAVLLGGRGDEVSAALAAGDYIRLGILSQYSIEIEERADRNGVKYLIATHKYNPVGMLTFMERLAAKERSEPQQDLGVYADHPSSVLRCNLIIGYLEKAGIDINRRATTKWAPPKVTADDSGGKKLSVLSLWGIDLFKTSYAGSSKTATERLTAAAARLKQALAAGAETYEFTVDSSGPNPCLVVRHKVLITFYPQDADPGQKPEQVAQEVVKNIGAALSKEELKRLF